jgi:hypothetical protein
LNKALGCLETAAPGRKFCTVHDSLQYAQVEEPKKKKSNDTADDEHEFTSGCSKQFGSNKNTRTAGLIAALWYADWLENDCLWLYS